MTKLVDELKVLMNKRVLAISNGTIYFEGGVSLDLHPYETYIGKYNIYKIRKKDIDYYSPDFFE